MEYTSDLLKIWLRRYLSCKKILSFDIETTGFNPRKKKIFSYCLCDELGNVEIHRLDLKDPIKTKKSWGRLKEVCADPNIGMLAHNYKFELSFLKSHKIYIHPAKVWHDTMLMSRMLRNLAQSHQLHILGWEILGYEIDTPLGLFNSKEIDEKVKLQAEARGSRYDRVDKDLMYWYQYADAERPMLLYLIWKDYFFKNIKMLKEYIVEILVSATSERMENTGMRIHYGNIEKIQNNLRNELDIVRDLIYKEYGEYFNLLNEAQLHRLLYKIEGYPILERSTKTGLPISNKDVLFALKDDYPDDKILDWIIKTRSYTNGLSMLDSYIEHAEDGIVHPNINSCQARTHRQSSSKPNLQNVSKKEARKNPFPVPARKCFRTKNNHRLILGDYSGIEMRLIIELANSLAMMQILQQGKSTHVVACEMFYGDLWKGKDKTPELYGAGKNAHFALGYGAGLTKLASVLLIPEEDAMKGLINYVEHFPEIAYLNKTIGKEVREYGYVMTPFGTKLYVPIRKAYTGLNYKIQNTAAKILKRAEINIDHYLKTVWSDDVKLSMVVHDEVILDFPNHLEHFKQEILYNCGNLMIDMPEIQVPLEVEWNESRTLWDNKIDLTIEGAQLWKNLKYQTELSKRLLIAA